MTEGIDRSNINHRMGERKTPRVELKEIPEGHAKFLAGIFEVGGSMYMTPATRVRVNSKGIKSESSWVESGIQYAESDKGKVDDLAERFGGTVTKHSSDNSWVWKARGLLALSLVNAIEKYAPSRQEEIRAFQALHKAETFEEKRIIAKALSRYNHAPKSYPDPEAYSGLVNDSDFIAGVYQGRESTYEYSNPLLSIISKNVTLVYVLHEAYGGSFVPVVQETQTAKKGATVSVSFRLQFGDEDRKRFLGVAYPSLISNKQEVARIIGEAA